MVFESLLRRYFLIFPLLFIFFFGIWNFETNPGFWFDEGLVSQQAKNLVEQGTFGIQTAPGEFAGKAFWVTVGYTVTVPQAPFFKLFGADIWSARLAGFLYMLGLAVVSYFFVRKIFGFRAAVFSVLLLVTFSPFYGNGKTALGETAGLFWLFTGGLFYFIYAGRKKISFLIFSALSFGLCAITKPYFLLLFPAISAFVLLLYFQKKENIKRLSLFMGGMLTPFFIWLVSILDISDLRSTFGYFLNSYNADTGSFLPLVLENITRFLSEATPIHFAFLTVVILFSIFFAGKNYKEPELLLAYLAFGALSFLWYLKTPGWYRYFYTIHVMAVLFFPGALFILPKYLKEKTKINFIKTAMVLILAIFAFQAVYLFKNHGQFYSEDMPLMEKFIKENIPKDRSVFVVSKPEIAFLLKTKNYYQTVFHNSDLIIGSNVLMEKRTDFVITDRDYVYCSADIDPILARDYGLLRTVGHYKIYGLKP